MNENGRNDHSSGREHDDHVLWVVIGFCLVVPVILVTIWQFTGKYYPPMLLSILLGIAVAALTYRYLGGSQGSVFSVGALKIVGSAALLIGTAYLANSGLTQQMDVNDSVNRLRNAESTISTLASDNKKINAELQKITHDLDLERTKNCQIIIEEIEKLAPDTLLGSRLAGMARKRLGPFSEIARESIVRISVAGVKNQGSFHACDDLKLKGEYVRFVRDAGEQSPSQNDPVSGRQTGHISLDQCAKSDRKFDIQISCADGWKLFPEHISGCDDAGAVKWKVPGGPRVFSASAVVLATGDGASI